MSVSPRMGILVQSGLTAAMLGFVVVAPPERGAFLLVPLTEAGARQVARLAIESDAQLVGRGPFGRSLIVEGDRARLAGTMLRAGIVPIAAVSGLCGGSELARNG